jgi:hypothetical protein
MKPLFGARVYGPGDTVDLCDYSLEPPQVVSSGFQSPMRTLTLGWPESFVHLGEPPRSHKVVNGKYRVQWIGTSVELRQNNVLAQEEIDFSLAP